MAKLVAPLMSISASGSIGKTVTYCQWKGVQYCREYFIPQNPSDPKQVNVRAALSLAVAEWKDVLTAEQKGSFNTAAEGQPYSGFNLYMKLAMLAYVSQLTTSVLPVSVAMTGNYPDQVFTWSAV